MLKFQKKNWVMKTYSWDSSSKHSLIVWITYKYD